MAGAIFPNQHLALRDEVFSTGLFEPLTPGGLAIGLDQVGQGVSCRMYAEG